MENNNLLQASYGAYVEDGPGGMPRCQPLHANPSVHHHLNYTFHILHWVLSDWDVTS